MNILIYTRFYPSEISGGVEHVTFILREQLLLLGHCVTILYSMECKNTDDVDAFKLPETNESEFVLNLCEKRDISKIIIQGDISKISLFNNLKSKINVFYVHHGDPGYGYTTTLLDTYFLYVKYGKWKVRFSNLLRILLFPLLKIWKYYTLNKTYKNLPLFVDKVVLLSEKSIESFQLYSGIKKNDFITYVNNPLSYEFSFKETINTKEKVVLIVSRLEEFTKKISLALRVWKIVMKNNKYNDWTLKIVGDGKDMDLYKAMVKDLNIPNVVFCGYDNPLPYYKISSIFLMTSVSEGWGMTLTEAMQNGCVPIAFDSYPAIHDIISHESNGILIKYPDINLYSNYLMELMGNNEHRESLSINTLESLKRFSKCDIAKRWVEVLLAC